MKNPSHPFCGRVNGVNRICEKEREFPTNFLTQTKEVFLQSSLFQWNLRKDNHNFSIKALSRFPFHPLYGGAFRNQNSIQVGFSMIAL